MQSKVLLTVRKREVFMQLGFCNKTMCFLHLNTYVVPILTYSSICSTFFFVKFQSISNENSVVSYNSYLTLDLLMKCHYYSMNLACVGKAAFYFLISCFLSISRPPFRITKIYGRGDIVFLWTCYMFYGITTWNNCRTICRNNARVLLHSKNRKAHNLENSIG